MNRKGIERVLVNVGEHLARIAPNRYQVACTRAGVSTMRAIFPESAIHAVAAMPKSIWEQLGLPLVATRLGAGAVYSHRECGALWGPPLLLHVPEDPEVRWRRDPPTDARARARRTYSQVFMQRSARRAHPAASMPAVIEQLATRLGIDASRFTLIPLGVDTTKFRSPATTSSPASPAPFFFHLASGDPRDGTELVVDGYEALATADPGAPELIIGGDVPSSEKAAVVRNLSRSAAKQGSVRRATHRSGARPEVFGMPRVRPALLRRRFRAPAAGGARVWRPAGDITRRIRRMGARRCRGPLGESLGDAGGRGARRAASDEPLRRRAALFNPRRAACFSWKTTADTIHTELCRIAR